MTDAVQRLSSALADRYTIERELGAGGMATVYLAEDLKHQRKVAVKVLRPELSAILGGERFLNEIRVTANLQHPHILALYDSGESGGLLYYVMPYVEGESLRDLLTREKQLGVEEAVEIARAVAGALAYAHSRGVIHRDIKPENILLQGGQALVADFGIALAVSNAGGHRLTETGLSLGTPNYMSPEQATGDRAVDGRSDIYSLACVAYEMLTGDPPHTGSTAQAVIAKIVTEQPALVTASRPAAPAHVTAAIHKALSKLPADRFHSATEFAEALVRPGMLDSVTGATRPGAPPRRTPDLRLTAAIAAGALALGYALARLTSPEPPGGRLGRFAIEVEPYTTLASGFAPGVALSRDGSHLAFVGRGPRGNQVFLRAMDDSVPRPVTGTEGAFSTLFSADGREIAFWTAAQRLSRVPLDGGVPVEIADSIGNVAVWMPEGGIVYADPRGRVLSVLETDGTQRELVRSDSGTFLALTPLPGGRTVLATLLAGARNRTSIVAVSLRDGSMRDIGLSDVLKAKYVDGGYLVYQRRAGSALLAARFDLGSMRLEGEGRPVAPPARITFRVIPQWDVSDDGTIAYVGLAPFELVLADRRGGVTVLQGEPRSYHHPRFSPDGRRIAMDITEAEARDVWVLDTQDRTLSRFTVGEIANDPYWSPDGHRIAYTAARGAFRGVFTRAADGTGGPESLLVDENDHSSGTWSPDGRTLVVSTGLVAGLWTVPAAGGDTARPVAGSRSSEAYPGFSPDGRWLAYVSDESGRQEVYVRPFPGPGGRVQISAAGGTEPVWSRDGRELFYRVDAGTGSRMIAAAVRTAPSFSVSSRTPVLDVSGFVPSEDHANFDVHPDGRRFVMVRSPQAGQIHLVLNWQAQFGQPR